jgi:hypothetical protein
VEKMLMFHRMHTTTAWCCSIRSKQSKWSKHWTLITSNRLCIIRKNTSIALIIMWRNSLSLILYSVGHMCQSNMSVTVSWVLVTEQFLYITPACI